MFRRKKEPQLTREQMLRSTVVANSALRVTRDKNGSVTLRVPLRLSPFLRRVLGRFAADASDQKSALDEVGSFVWDMCDGRTTVLEMITRISERYKLNRKETEISLTTYLRTLMGKNYVAILVPEPKEGGDAPHE